MFVLIVYIPCEQRKSKLVRVSSAVSRKTVHATIRKEGLRKCEDEASLYHSSCMLSGRPGIGYQCSRRYYHEVISGYIVTITTPTPFKELTRTTQTAADYRGTGQYISVFDPYYQEKYRKNVTMAVRILDSVSRNL